MVSAIAQASGDSVRRAARRHWSHEVTAPMPTTPAVSRANNARAGPSAGFSSAELVRARAYDVSSSVRYRV